MIKINEERKYNAHFVLFEQNGVSIKFTKQQFPFNIAELVGKPPDEFLIEDSETKITKKWFIENKGDL